MAGPYQALRLRVQVENTTTPLAELRNRDDGLRHALIAAHSLIAVPGASVPVHDRSAGMGGRRGAACQQLGHLAGAGRARLAALTWCCPSPVILYDHPEVAAESAGNLFDATEIDEILTLRTLTLTDAEKRQARATDSRAAELIDRLDDMPPEMLERMHGAIRYLRSAPAGAAASATAAGGPCGSSAGGAAACRSARWRRNRLACPGGDGPAVGAWWDPGSDASVSPETDHVLIDGVRVARNSRVLMQPGSPPG